MSARSAGRAEALRRPVGAPVAMSVLLFLLATAPTPLVAQEAASAGSGTGTHDATGLAAAAWLAGCWEASSPDGGSTVEELWTAPRGGLMLGLSRSMRGGEVRGYEHLTIRQEDGSLVYHAIPSGQSPTDFPDRSVQQGRLEFVNEHHDFPQKIVYSRLAADSVRAKVFAEVDDTEPAFALPYARVACPGS